MYEQQGPPDRDGGHAEMPMGTPVYDSDGAQVGTVTSADAASGALIVRHGHLFGHDYAVQREAIARVDASGVYLNVRKDSLRGAEPGETAGTHANARTDVAVGPAQTPTTPLAAVTALPDAVQQTAGQVTQAAQQAAGDTLEAVRREAEGARGVVHEKAAESMVTASDGLAGAATAVGQVSERLRQVDHGVLSQYTDRAAQQLEELAARLRTMTPEQALHEVEQLARRQPALFMAAAFAVGLLGARVLHGASGSDEKREERR